MASSKKGRRRPSVDGSTPSIWDNRTRLLALAMIAFAVVLLVWTVRRDAPATKAQGEEPSSTSATGGPAAAGGGGMFGMAVGAGTPSAAPSAAPPDPPPVIDEVSLEKKEVCAGEENLVTVKAHTTNGTDAFLHTLIDGQQGSSIPVRLWRDDDGNVLGQHTITVFGRGNVATTIPVPQYEVKNCRPTYIADVMQRVRSNTWSDFDFNARIVGIPRAPTPADRERGAPPPPVPKPFKPVSFSWDFGDGQTATSLTPIIEHDFEGRPQTSLYSYFVVGVSIRGTKGETATGRTVLSLVNPAFEALATKGIVSLMISLDPRFPELGSDGKVTQNVRIWHIQPGPVTIDRATLTKYFKQAAGQTAPQDVPVTSVLGTAIIPPGKEGITVTVVLDPSSEEEVFAKTWNLSGTSAEGFPAMGSFSVMVPPPKPSADAGDTVFDPLLKQKIILARQMLGKDVVNDEDLWRLEREGAFANLKVTPEETAAAATAAIAAAQQKGPPGQQPTYVPKGPPVPVSTAQQLAPPGQGSGPAPASSK
jgi:hypothetical protein